MMRKILTAFCVGFVGVGILLPVPAIGTPPVPVETVTGCVKDGQMLIQAPERFKREKALKISPCTNIPFDVQRFEGKQIRAKAGIDLYNGAFVCPREVQIVGDCKPARADTPPKKDLPRQLSDDEADEIVWGLPEVQGMLERMKGTKVSPYLDDHRVSRPEGRAGQAGRFLRNLRRGKARDPHGPRHDFAD